MNTKGGYHEVDKASERVPDHKNLVHIKYLVRLNDEPPYITTAFFDGKTWHRQDQLKGFDLPESIEWPDESSTLSYTIEDMMKAYDAGCGDVNGTEKEKYFKSLGI